jgi:hypothetical protein
VTLQKKIRSHKTRTNDDAASEAAASPAPLIFLQILFYTMTTYLPNLHAPWKR